MREIRRVKRQWEREMEEEESSFSSLDSSEDLDEGHHQIEDVEMQGEEKREKRPAVRVKAMFGALPGAEDMKLPVIKSVVKERREKVKRFELGQFLDQYLEISGQEDELEVPVSQDIEQKQ